MTASSHHMCIAHKEKSSKLTEISASNKNATVQIRTTTHIVIELSIHFKAVLDVQHKCIEMQYKVLCFNKFAITA